MSDIRNCYGDHGIGPDISFLERWNRETERLRRADLAAAIERHGIDGLCRACNGSGRCDTDGVYGPCWACRGEGGRTEATIGAYVP